MSKVYADNIEPRDSSMDVTIGTSTNTITLAGNDLRANTVKDSGGNTLWTSDGSGNLSSVNSGLAGNLVLLSTQTSSGASSVSFTSDIDDTYDVYVFKLIEINPSVDNTRINVNFSADGGSNWMTKTSTYFRAIHRQAGTNSGIAYDNGDDLAQSTDKQRLCHGIGSAASECGVGDLTLFSPTSTTYVKHWYSTMQVYYPADGEYSIECFTAGYCNTTSAINLVKYEMSSGNFDGIIKMYGVL
jgi:hypothetical protein